MSDTPAPLAAALEDRYAIERKLGQGGMATVYLARDLKHNRSVALKVLKPELAAVVGAERFLAEIETTANLQHPHILPLYDSGQAGSFLYYVMPYVEGRTLRERLDAEKQVPVEEAVRIATAVASALDFAHRQGVVHRDIKPGNILFQDGEPVVGDFGIALAVGAGGRARLTETGLSLGTPYYMSPEQATGDQQVGPPSDIYSLGCVLYEMLAGGPPYTGATAQAVLGQIIAGKATSVTAVRPSVPANVEAAIRRALEKVPADRFRTANEFAAALANPAFHHGADTSAANAGQVRRWKRVAVGLAVIAAALATALIASVLQGPEPRGVSRYPLPPARADSVATETFISPDGSTVAYWVVTGVAPYGNSDLDSTEIRIRDRNELDPRPLPGTEGALSAAFSPDSRYLAFVDLDLGRPPTSTIRVVPLDGGSPVTIVDGAPGIYNPLTWGEDGYLYATSSYPNPGVYRIAPVAGAVAEPIPLPEELASARAIGPVRLLPGGRGLVGSSSPTGVPDSSEVWVIDLETQRYSVVGRGRAPVYVSTGHLLWLAPGGGLMARRFDLDDLAVEGTAVRTLDDVLDFSISDAGDLIYDRVTGGESAMEVVWIDRNGGVGDVIDMDLDLEPGRLPMDPALSPDGTRLALVVPAGPDSARIIVKDLSAGTLTPLKAGGSYQTKPAWSANSREIGYVSDRVDGQERLWVERADGSGRPVALTGPVDPSQLDMGRWAPDQPTILAGGTRGLNAVSPGRDSTLTSLYERGTAYDNPTLAPNGRWVAYVERIDGRRRVFASPFPNLNDQRIPISDGEGFQPRWSNDGQEVFYATPRLGGTDLRMARISAGGGLRVESRDSLFTWFGPGAVLDGWAFDVNAAGTRFVVVRSGPRGKVGPVLVENFFEELVQKVGPGR